MAVALTTTTDGINRLAITNNNAANERKANAVKWLDASATAVRSGILPGPGVWTLSYGSPTADTYYVTAGSAVLADGAGGALEVTSGSTKSEAVTRPGAGTSRYDVIALEPVFTGTPSASIVRYAGTAAASPSLSTATSQVTANGLILGYYLLGNSGAPAITQVPKRTSVSGGVVRVYDATDLATLNPVDGDLGYQEDVDVLYLRRNGAWEPVSAAPHFRAVASGATGLVGGANIAFPVVEDTDSGWQSGPSNYKVKRAGVYRVSAHAKFASASSNNFAISKNGSALVSGNAVSFPAFGGLEINYEDRFALNDTIAVQVGTTMTTQNDSPAVNSWVDIDFVRP